MDAVGAGSCPRCGEVLPSCEEPRRGRRQIWCGPECRRSAHAERVAAARGITPVRVVEVPRRSPAVVQIRTTVVAEELDSSEAAERVLADREALQRVLWEVTRRARARRLGRIRDDVFDLADAVNDDPARHRKRPDFLERLLAEDAEDHCDYDDPFA